MATNEDIVAAAQQLYVSYYGRWADPAGLDFWIEKFTESDNVDQVLTDFGTSEEYLDWIEDNGLDTSEDLVNALYQQMFNRDGDAGGIAFYVGQLESGASSLASIALDIANGASGDDVIALDNKVGVSNVATTDIDAGSKVYTSSDIPAAQAALAVVDATDESVVAGTAAAAAVVDDLPVAVEGGDVTLDEETASADFSGSTSAVNVTLDGDDDEAAFDVVLSAFDDTVIFEEGLAADVDGGDGVDTADFSELNNPVVVNLLTGLHTVTDFVGGVSLANIENIVGTDDNDTLTGDSGDNSITPGEGNDNVKGGLGADVFVFTDAGDLDSNDNIDGGAGDDTLSIADDNVDLVTGAPLGGISNIEHIEIISADDISVTAGAASLIRSGSLSANGEGENTLTIPGTAGGYNAAGVTVSGFDIWELGGSLIVDLTQTGNTFVGTGTSGLFVAGVEGFATYNFTNADLTGVDFIGSFDGGAIDDTVIINQTAVSALQDATDARSNEIFLGASGGAAAFIGAAPFSGNDILQLSGTAVDLSSMGILPFAEIAIADAGKLVVNEITLNNLGAGIDITGGDGANELIIDGGSNVNLSLTNPNFGGQNIDLGGVETLIADVEGSLTISNETTDDGLRTIITDATLIGQPSSATELPVLLGITLEGVTELGGTFVLGSSNLTTVDTVNNLTAIHVGGPLDLSAINTGFFSATGVVSIAAADISGAQVPGNYTFNEGDDSFIGSVGLFAATNGLAKVTLAGGDDTATAGDAGAILNGGAGADILTGHEDAASILVGGPGNDLLNAENANDVLAGGAGADIFTIAAKAFGATLVGTSTAATSVTAVATTTFSSISTGANTVSVSEPVVSVTGATSLQTALGTFSSTTGTGISRTGTASAAITYSTTITGNEFSASNLQSDVIQLLVGTSVSSPLADALTSAGGLRVVNLVPTFTASSYNTSVELGTAVNGHAGQLGTLANGSAIGTGRLGTVTLATATVGTGTTSASDLTNTAAVKSALTGLTGSNLLDTTFVAFAFASGALMAFLVTADSNATNGITIGEISSFTVANFMASGASLAEADILIV